MSKEITFSFTLNKQYVKHLPEKSSYNHNYYKLEFSYYGDFLPGGICNILFEENDDVSDATYYTLGYFENDKFISCFTWLEETYKDLP